MSESFEVWSSYGGRFVLPPGMPAAEEYYDRTQCWPPESLERRKAYLKETK